MEEHLGYLPEITRIKAMTPYAYFVNQIYGAALVGATFICAHYLQQLDISRLTSQKHMIKKQQQQLTAYFKSQKDGILIYQTHVMEDGDSLFENSLAGINQQKNTSIGANWILL